MQDREATVTQLLTRLGGGDESAVDILMPLIYDELHRMASRHLDKEGRERPVQTTSLVHEAYLKLVDLKRINWQNRAHFLSIAALVMRRILVDMARRRLAKKRGGDKEFVSFDEQIHFGSGRAEMLLDLDAALSDLEKVSARQSRIIEFKCFGGLSFEEIASVLDVSLPTVRRDWRFALAWMKTELKSS